MKSGIWDNIMLKSKITGGSFDDCEFVDGCDGVADRDPCDHILELLSAKYKMRPFSVWGS